MKYSSDANSIKKPKCYDPNWGEMNKLNVETMAGAGRRAEQATIHRSPEENSNNKKIRRKAKADKSSC